MSPTWLPFTTQTTIWSSPINASIIPPLTNRSAAAPSYGVTDAEAEGIEVGVAEGAVGLTHVLAGGGATDPPVAGGAGGAVHDPVP